jgi:hypothetical protein
MREHMLESAVDVMVLSAILVACLLGRSLFEGSAGLGVLTHPWIYAWAALMVLLLAMTKTFFPRCVDTIYASAVMNSMSVMMSPLRAMSGAPQ